MAATRSLSDDHKKALAQGRLHGKIVTDYLDALDQHKPKRGRQDTPAQLSERIKKLDAEIPKAHGAQRLDLVQQKLDLEERLRSLGDDTAIKDLEKQFVKVAKPYAERKGYTPQAFRAVGVPVSVLKEAGLV